MFGSRAIARALASSPDKPLTRAVGGQELGFTDVAEQGKALLAAYAEAWLGYRMDAGGGGAGSIGGGGAGSTGNAGPITRSTFLPSTGSRLPPPSTWLLADYGATAHAAGRALHLFLGLEKSSSPLARLPSPSCRLPLLLDVAVGIPPSEPWRDDRARWCLAALLARGVAPASEMTAAAAARCAASFAADSYGDRLFGGLVARLFLPGTAPDAVLAAFDALNDADALWTLPPLGDVEGLDCEIDDQLGARLSTALAGGRFTRALGQARSATSALAALALDWTAARCFGNDAMLRSFVATAPIAELAALLAWGEEDGREGRVAARAAAARAAAAGNGELERRVREAAEEKRG